MRAIGGACIACMEETGSSLREVCEHQASDRAECACRCDCIPAGGRQQGMWPGGTRAVQSAQLKAQWSGAPAARCSEMSSSSSSSVPHTPWQPLTWNWVGAASTAARIVSAVMPGR